ncbi:hypothetical protein RVM26_11265 [Halomonas sp. KM072]
MPEQEEHLIRQESAQGKRDHRFTKPDQVPMHHDAAQHRDGFALQARPHEQAEAAIVRHEIIKRHVHSSIK